MQMEKSGSFPKKKALGFVKKKKKKNRVGKS